MRAHSAHGLDSDEFRIIGFHHPTWFMNRERQKSHWTIFYVAIRGDIPRVSAKVVVINHFHSKLIHQKIIVASARGGERECVQTAHAIEYNNNNEEGMCLLCHHQSVFRWLWSPKVCWREATIQNHINVAIKMMVRTELFYMKLRRRRWRRRQRWTHTI